MTLAERYSEMDNFIYGDKENSEDEKEQNIWQSFKENTSEEKKGYPMCELGCKTCGTE